MGYVTLQAAARTILTGVTGYLDADTVTLGDYGVLDDGPSHCAVLRPGSFPDDGGTMAYQTDREWHILIDIFRKWINDNDTLQLFSVFRDAVVAKLDQYPTLNLQSTVRVLGVYSDFDPVDVNDENGSGPFYIMQRIRIRVREKVFQTGGEYA